MFDNLRDTSNSTPFYDDEAKFADVPDKQEAAPRKAGPFLGMTPKQRFIVALMILIATCALGSMCLLITGRISLIPGM